MQPDAFPLYLRAYLIMNILNNRKLCKDKKQKEEKAAPRINIDKSVKAAKYNCDSSKARERSASRRRREERKTKSRHISMNRERRSVNKGRIEGIRAPCKHGINRTYLCVRGIRVMSTNRGTIGMSSRAMSLEIGIHRSVAVTAVRVASRKGQRRAHTL